MKCLPAPSQTGNQNILSAEVTNATSSLTLNTLTLLVQTTKELRINITHEYTKSPQNFI